MAMVGGSRCEWRYAARNASLLGFGSWQKASLQTRRRDQSHMAVAFCVEMPAPDCGRAACAACGRHAVAGNCAPAARPAPDPWLPLAVGDRDTGCARRRADYRRRKRSAAAAAAAAGRKRHTMSSRAAGCAGRELAVGLRRNRRLLRCCQAPPPVTTPPFLTAADSCRTARTAAYYRRA